MLGRKSDEEKLKSGVKGKAGEPCCQSQHAGPENEEQLWGLSQKPQTRGAKTRITVRYDVGFSNTVSIRGKGANLSWDRGVQLKNLKPDLWVYETDAPFTQIEFKVLINDQVYEEGENRTLKNGSQIEYTPKFPSFAHR